MSIFIFYFLYSIILQHQSYAFSRAHIFTVATVVSFLSVALVLFRLDYGKFQSVYSAVSVPLIGWLPAVFDSLIT